MIQEIGERARASRPLVGRVKGSTPLFSINALHICYQTDMQGKEKDVLLISKQVAQLMSVMMVYF